ncbi:MAG: hypothetical protein PHS41_00785, partial [Victivallaceae bacterium]|nr:hypothetical protein [Victivallaceae bacterium]
RGVGNTMTTGYVPLMISAGGLVQVEDGGELAIDLGKVGYTVNSTDRGQFAIAADGRLAFITTGVMQSSLSATVSGDTYAGTIGMYGKITVGDWLDKFDNGVTSIEVGGNVTLTEAITWQTNFTINGTVALSGISGSGYSITSVQGSVTIGGRIDPSGAFVSGSGTFNGGGKDLTISAKTNAYVGELAKVANLTVQVSDADGVIGLTGAISVTGRVSFNQTVEVLRDYDAKGNLTNIKLSAAEMVFAESITGSAAASALELVVTSKTQLTNLGTVNMDGKLVLTSGQFTVGDFTAGGLENKASLTITGAGTVNGDLNMLSGALNATSTLTVTEGGTFTAKGGEINIDHLILGDSSAGGILGGELVNSGAKSLTIRALETYANSSIQISKNTQITGDMTLNGFTYLEVKSGILAVGGTLINNSVGPNGALAIVNRGTITAASIVSAGTIQSYGSIVCTGAIIMTDSSLSVVKGTLYADSISVMGGIFTNAGTVKVNSVWVNDGVNHSGGMVNSGTMVAGYDPNDLKSTIWVAQVVVNGSGGLVNTGTLSATALTIGTDSSIANTKGTLSAMNLMVGCTEFNNAAKLALGTSMVFLNGDHSTFVNNGTADGVKVNKTMVYGTVAFTSSKFTLSNATGKSAKFASVFASAISNKGTLSVFDQTEVTELVNINTFTGGRVVILDGGLLDNSGKFSLTIDKTVADGTSGSIDFAGSGRFVNAKGKTVTAGSITMGDSVTGGVTTFTNAGTVKLTGTVTVDRVDKTQAAVASTGALVIYGSAAPGSESAAALLNTGTINATAISVGAALGDAEQAYLSNSGTITVAAVTVNVTSGAGQRVVGSILNPVANTLEDGLIYVHGIFDNDKKSTVKAGGMVLTGNAGAGEVAFLNLGTVTLSQKTVNVKDPGTGVSTITVVSDGMLEITGTGILANGSMDATSGVVYSGKLTATAVLMGSHGGLFNYGTLTATGSSDIAGTGLVTIDDGAFYNHDKSSFSANVLSVGGTGNDLTNYGTIKLTSITKGTNQVGAALIVSDGSIYNGRILASGGSVKGTINVTGAATLLNSGRIAVTGGDFWNLSGAVTANKVAIEGDLFNGAKDNASTAAKVRWISSTISVTALSGKDTALIDPATGSLIVGGGVTNRAGSITTKAVASLENSGKLEAASIVSDAAMTIGGDVAISGDVTNSSTMTVSGDSMTVTGRVVSTGKITASKAAVVAGGLTNSDGVVSVLSLRTGDLTNNGSFTASGEVVGTGVSLDGAVVQGRFNNGQGSTFKAGNLSVQNTYAMNYGTMNVSMTLTLLNGSTLYNGPGDAKISCTTLRVSTTSSVTGNTDNISYKSRENSIPDYSLLAGRSSLLRSSRAMMDEIDLLLEDALQG